MDRQTFRSIFVRYWPLAAEAVVVLILVLIFGGILNHRQQVGDARAERQRQAICAILANIPGHIPPEIAHARRVFARPGHRDDCTPVQHPMVRAVTPTPTPGPTRTVLVGPPKATAPHRPRSSSSPSPTATHLPSPRPSPSPSPSPTCDLLHPLRCITPSKENP